MTLLLVVFAKSLSNFCNYKNSCDLLNDESEFLNLISIVCQFYVFKIFDKNFKISLSDLKANLRHFIFKSKKSNNLNLAQEGNFELKNLNNLIGNGLLDWFFLSKTYCIFAIGISWTYNFDAKKICFNFLYYHYVLEK